MMMVMMIHVQTNTESVQCLSVAYHNKVHVTREQLSYTKLVCPC